MKRASVLLLIAAAALPACQNTNMPWNRNQQAQPVVDNTGAPAYEAPAPTEPGLPLATEQRFADIPLPAGAKEDLEKSFVFESSTLQIGRMVYDTKASVTELSSFYIRECPTAGWTLRSVTQAGGADLAFTKPGKKLTVIIRDLGITKGRQLIVTMVPE